MAYDLYSTDLPIKECFSDIESHVNADNTLIIHAPPGAGKSTLVPLLLLNKDWLNGSKIVMLEPRRLAAKTIAQRMASLLGEKVGETVGYRIRFESNVSNKTKIEVVTEGILTRMLQSDNSLEGIGALLFDEFHERSIHADLALALSRESQEVLRPDLRIVVMSATLNIPQLQKMLNAPVVSSEGRQYNVDVFYGDGVDVRVVADIVARKTIDAVKKHEGDALVFLPGQAEIMQCADILKKALPNFAIHPLYGMLSQGKQYRAIVPDKNGRRKVVIATSIAETSLTIEGVKIVIDSGLGRTARFDQKTGMMRLETVPISHDSAQQRSGRAGRLSEGVCYRLWSLADHHKMNKHSVPEILEADLSSLVLELAHWGIDDVHSLKWLDVPPPRKLEMAEETLEALNVLENRKITSHGKEVHALPCHPRIAHMLIMAEDEGLSSLACDVAALLEERDPMNSEAGIDINLRIEKLRQQRKEQRLDKAFTKIERISAQYRRMLSIREDNSLFDPYETGLLISFAYPERIACSRVGNNAQFQLANGKIAMIGHKDDLAYESWLSIAHVDARDGMGKIFLASPLNPKDLASMVKNVEVVQWRTKEGGLLASNDLRIGSIVLQKKPIQNPDPQKVVDAICIAMKREGESALTFSPQVRQWQNRVLSLKKWYPNEDWPLASTEALLQTCDEWLSPYLASIKKNEDLKKLDLLEILHSSLSYEQQQLLNERAPERLEVLSGSRIMLQYSDRGENPVLAVRIQEVFGLKETPTINNGQTPVLLHLLSPASRPVQITSDLASFWNGAYHEIKKELKIKYPKHVWPDDPWNEPAIRGIKRKKKP